MLTIFTRMMSGTRPQMVLAACAVLLLALAPARAEPAGASPVVVELFTSQGCSSCPPADAYLSELARTPGVLALSMHVDYWNGLGWKDPYSRADVTQRQRDYVRALGGHFVYTPQMVVMGRADAVGTRKADVAKLIARNRAAMTASPSIDIRHAVRDRLQIRIGAQPFTGQATVWLLSFDSHHSTKVAAGENGGKVLNYSNVVRGIRAIGNWTGAAVELTADIAEEMSDGYENCAILIQASGTGAIIAAGSMPMRMASR